MNEPNGRLFTELALPSPGQLLAKLFHYPLRFLVGFAKEVDVVHGFYPGYHYTTDPVSGSPKPKFDSVPLGDRDLQSEDFLSSTGNGLVWIISLTPFLVALVSLFF